MNGLRDGHFLWSVVTGGMLGLLLIPHFYQISLFGCSESWILECLFCKMELPPFNSDQNTAINCPSVRLMVGAPK